MASIEDQMEEAQQRKRLDKMVIKIAHTNTTCVYTTALTLNPLPLLPWRKFL